MKKIIDELILESIRKEFTLEQEKIFCESFYQENMRKCDLVQEEYIDRIENILTNYYHKHFNDICDRLTQNHWNREILIDFINGGHEYKELIKAGKRGGLDVRLAKLLIKQCNKINKKNKRKLEHDLLKSKSHI